MILWVTFSAFKQPKPKMLRKKCYIVYYEGDSIVKLNNYSQFTLILKKNSKSLYPKIKNGEIYIDESFLNDSSIIDIEAFENGNRVLFKGQNPRGLKSTGQIILNVFNNPEDIFYKEECYPIIYEDCKKPRGYVLEFSNFHACQRLCSD
jgi:hypothetical protein